MKRDFFFFFYFTLFAAPSQAVKEAAVRSFTDAVSVKGRGKKICERTQEKIHNTDTEDWAPCYGRSLRHKTETGDWEPC